MKVQTFPFAQNELFFNSQNHSFAFIFMCKCNIMQLAYYGHTIWILLFS